MKFLEVCSRIYTLEQCLTRYYMVFYRIFWRITHHIFFWRFARGYYPRAIFDRYLVGIWKLGCFLGFIIKASKFHSSSIAPKYLEIGAFNSPDKISHLHWYQFHTTLGVLAIVFAQIILFLLISYHLRICLFLSWCTSPGIAHSQDEHQLIACLFTFTKRIEFLTII